MSEQVFGGNVALSDRSRFIRATYTYLGGAIVAFVLLSTVLYMSGLGHQMLSLMGASKYAWLAVLGGFMVVSWLATSLADNSDNNTTQTMGLGIYVIAEAIIFAPVFAMASLIAPDAIGAAALVTLLLVGGLTWTAFSMKTDFSFLGGLLRVAGIVALGAIIASVIFGFTLGIWFSAIMVIFAGGCVLYDTSNIIHHYPSNRPAGAALHLFASIALMLWYVLRILLELTRGR